MSSGSAKKASRESRERARVFQARHAYQDGLVRRRKRDNVIALVGGGVLLLAIIGGQVAYFTAGPGAPDPVPTQTSTPSPTPTG